MEAQNTQKKAQHSIRIFAWLVPLEVAIVIGNLLFRLGMRFIPGLNPVYAWISLGVQLLLYAVSTITVFRRWHKYNNVRLKDMRDRLLQKKKRVDRGEKGLRTTLALSVIGCFVWIFLCIAAAVATLFFSGRRNQSDRLHSVHVDFRIYVVGHFGDIDLLCTAEQDGRRFGHSAAGAFSADVSDAG